VTQPVGQRRRQVPAVGGLFRWVGRRDHTDVLRQFQITDHPFQDHAQQRRLHGGRRGRELVEKQQPAA
jgi:hypothetical protein